jgi:arylsulfatase
METIDEETLAAAKDYIQRQVKSGQPFFCWWNATRMHFRTHIKEATLGKSGQDEYSDGMVEHDAHVGQCRSRRPVRNGPSGSFPAT